MTKQYNNPTGTVKRKVPKSPVGSNTAKQVSEGYNAFMKKRGIETKKFVLSAR